MAKSLIQGIQAQPYLVELLHMDPLFQSPEEPLTGEFALYASHLKRMVFPAGAHQDEVSREERLEAVAALQLNKKAERKAKLFVEATLADSAIDLNCNAKASAGPDSVLLNDGTVIATTPYVMEKVHSILEEIEVNPFGHFALRGPPGSGKMTLIRLADHLVANRYATVDAKDP